MKKEIKKITLLMLILLTCTILFTACVDKPLPPVPVITYQYNINMDLNKGIEYDWTNGDCFIPEITVDKLSDGVKVDSAAYTGDIIMEENEFLYYDNGRIYIKDYGIIEFSTTIILNLERVLGDSGSGKVQISFPVKRLPIKATAIELYIDTRGILYVTEFYGTEFGAGAASVNTTFTPSGASYQGYDNIIFSIEYVIKDSEKITENLESYADISETGFLTLVGNGLYVGDKIGVKAKTVKEGVESAIREIEVIKISVQSVRLVLNQTLVGNGENAYYDFNYSRDKGNQIGISLEPWNATFRDDISFTIINAEECPFVSIGTDEYGRPGIIIDDETFVKYKTVEFYITIDGVQSNIVKVYIY